MESESSSGFAQVQTLTSLEIKLTEMELHLTKKAAEYFRLSATLRSLPQIQTLDGLIPLGPSNILYFRGRMVHTNELMVLLGANYFAVRSAAQAAGIADRRQKYLESERGAISEQVLNVRVKLQCAMANMFQSDPSSLTLTTSTRPVCEPNSGVLENGLPAFTCEVFPDSLPNFKENSPPLQDAETLSERESASSVSTEDRLTLEELEAIEEELGELVNNEKLCEMKLKEATRIKRERRLGNSQRSPEPNSTLPKYRTPGDIGVPSVPPQQNDTVFERPQAKLKPMTTKKQK